MPTRILSKIVCALIKPVLFFSLPIGILTSCFGWKYAGCFSLLYIFFKWRQIFVIIRTLPRDFRYIYGIWKVVTITNKYEREDTTLAKIFQRQVSKTPEKSCFLYGNEVWTFRDVEELSNRIGNLFLKQGLKRGDVVALMMSNCPEYVAVWLGLSKLGVTIALINTALRGRSLSHCVSIANSTAVIFSSDFRTVVGESCSNELMFMYVRRGEPNSFDGSLDSRFQNLNTMLASSATHPPEPDNPPHFSDNLLYIYTSGTTGLPKAAIIQTYKFVLSGVATYIMMRMTKEDIVYNCLPLNHSSGGCLGIAPCLMFGVTTAIRSKFSASNYFPDCINYKATVGLYIGEMCRYLLSIERKPGELSHRLRLMLGNGMKPTIWSKFIERFKIPQIYEFYGATEGNVNMVNLDNKLGAVGYIPNLIPSSLYPIGVVKTDPDTGVVIRDKNGFCIRCKPGEPGMLVGLIDSGDPTRKFEGYVDKAESKKKIITHIFQDGDAAFVSGDIVVMDELGFIYFKDRTGDTFRWKGENVATGEVEAVLSNCPGLVDSVIYGVPIGDTEGKAGMAALVKTQEFDMEQLVSLLDRSLPLYARPLFLRFVPSVQLTATFKLKKVDLQKLGFDPSVSPSDHLLFFRQGSSFVPLSSQYHDDIISGKIKL